MASSPVARAAALSLQFADLNTSHVPLEKLRADSEVALQRALEEIEAEAITLVLPHRLTTLLTHIFPKGLASLTKVRECVELADELAKVHCRAVVYLSLPQVEDVRSIATHAGLLLSVQSSDHTFSLVACGRWTTMCAEALHQQRLNDVIRIIQTTIGFIPLDADLVTLGRDRCLYDSVVHSNKSALDDLATSLLQMEHLYGEFDYIKGKGELASYVAHRLMHDAHPQALNEKKRRHKNGSEMTLVLLDRTVDLASALSSPLTLEALVDELLDSRDGFATMSETDQVIPMNASDPVYSRVRGQNILAVSASLRAEATAMKEAFERFRDSSATASTAEVHEFVKNVPAMKASQSSMERLVEVVETIERTTSSPRYREAWRLERAIMDFDPDADISWIYEEIEQLIFRSAPMLTVLRLLCLASVTHDGIPRDQLLRLKMRFLQTYGQETMFSFANLDRLGLLRMAERESHKSNFAQAATALQSIDIDVDPFNPGSMAFVTSGYAPISCSLVEELLKNGNWASFDAAMGHIPGTRSEIKKVAEPRKARKEESASSAGDTVRQPHIMVVCFIGGVTYMEVAALRWLSRYYPSHQIVIAATSLLNSNSFLNDVLERIPSTT